MVGMARGFVLLAFCAVLAAGCQRERVTKPGVPAVTPPEVAMPAEDTPPSHAGDYSPAVHDGDKASLIYYAKLDLLRLLVCSRESVQLSEGAEESDVLRNAVAEHFTDLGFRVVDGSPCPDYDSPAAQLSAIASQRDVDMFILLRAVAKPYGRFGAFHSFEAEARGKVSQISDTELLTMKTSTLRGKRDDRENVAAETALAAAGQELAHKLSDEILRKSARGLLLRRLEVRGVRSAKYADFIRVELEDKLGVEAVSLKSWDEKSEMAIFWVRVNADAKENLAAYVEQLKGVRLRVERVDKTGVQSR